MGRIVFVSAQDGLVERELKEKLANSLLSEPSVTKAYLVRVAYSATFTTRVAFCLEGGHEFAERIVRSTSEVFRQMFSTAESLDVLFLNDSQVREVTAVAKPFYTRPGDDSSLTTRM